MTKTYQAFLQRQKEPRLSRIKRAKDWILLNTTASLMNNQKWYRLFLWLENHRLEFELKTLPEYHKRSCDMIRELETTSILIDAAGDFIEFLEIESIAINKSDELIRALKEQRVEFHDHLLKIEINGYLQ